MNRERSTMNASKLADQFVDRRVWPTPEQGGKIADFSDRASREAEMERSLAEYLTESVEVASDALSFGAQPVAAGREFAGCELTLAAAHAAGHAVVERLLFGSRGGYLVVRATPDAATLSGVSFARRRVRSFRRISRDPLTVRPFIIELLTALGAGAAAERALLHAWGYTEHEAKKITYPSARDDLRKLMDWMPKDTPFPILIETFEHGVIAAKLILALQSLARDSVASLTNALTAAPREHTQDGGWIMRLGAKEVADIMRESGLVGR
jgi:hypothetical protein